MQNLIELRHILHQHPELSGQEALTNRILNEWVKQTLPDRIIERIGGYGLAAIYKGANPGKRIMIRGDIDAPIARKTLVSRTNAATMVTPPSYADLPNGSASNAPTEARWYFFSSPPKKLDKAHKPSLTTLCLSKSSPMWLTGCTTCLASKKAKSWCARAALRQLPLA